MTLFNLVILLTIADMMFAVFHQISKPEHVNLIPYKGRRERMEKAQKRSTLCKYLFWLTLATNIGLTIYLTVSMVVK